MKKNKILEWLLEEDNPSVRYFTLKGLLEKRENDAEVKAAKKLIMKKGAVAKILAGQKKEGCWDEPKKFYRSKYKGTTWQLIILAELGADAEDERIKKACEFILKHSQDKESMGFSVDYSVTAGCGAHSFVVPCLTGNMIWSLIRLGYLEDRRVKGAIGYITKYQRFDDKDALLPDIWPYNRYRMCFGEHTCHMGAVKALRALAEIPPEMRSREVKEKIKQGAEYFLKHHIYRRSHNLEKIGRPGWLHLGFPLMYQSDILEILDILTSLGYKDERMDDAVKVLLSKRTGTGKWLLENTFNGRYQVNIETRGKPSKWLTLRALKVLKRMGKT